MLTKFGKTVRKLRIDKGDSLKDMAETLGKTSSYVSAVETGKKNPTYNMVREIAGHYSLTPDQTKELQLAAEESRHEIILHVEACNDQQRQVAAAMARHITELTDDEVEQIRSVLDKKEK